MLRSFVKIVAVLASLLIAIDFASAANSPQSYAAAQQNYLLQLDLKQKLMLQMFLISAGYLNSVPDKDFNPNTFAALQRFQSDNGLPASGILDNATLKQLINAVTPMLVLWGFRKVTHPSRPVAIWVPLGLGLASKRTDNGLQFEDAQKSLLINFVTFKDVSALLIYNLLLETIAKDGSRIISKEIKENGFVISSKTSDGANRYLRYMQDGPNVTGFTLSWNYSRGDFHGERIALLISASLLSSLAGVPFIDPPLSGSSDTSDKPGDK